ncbi:MAG: hypothetical protein EA356_10520 [Geminicoccaceae bacterium]|nr:MAG: hypothetical protein EA356_10520 [Geminicoccaceae bacterium]
MRRTAALWLTALLLVLGGAGEARAATIVADLSRHLIPITTAFGGSDVLLFGTADEADDVIVVVRGPSETITVRRKDRFAGIWLNQEAMTFRDIPAFYAVAATRPPDEILGPGALARHGIGLEHLRLATDEASEAERLQRFRAGLIRNKQREALYADDLRVRFLGRGLFRTTIPFPANVPPGRYQVEVFAIQGGSIVAAQQSALVISKVGFEARMSDVAQDQAPLYALGAISFAIFAGWMAALAFRRN